VQRAADGRTLSGERSWCALDRASFAESQSAGLSFVRHLDVLDKASSLQVLVRDLRTARVGSIAIYVT